jgi:precorrin-3B synthase
MSASVRRGACPALSAPMPTGDGLLVRLLPVSGGLSPKSLIGLCESAARHGNGVIEVTARGSLQFRGFSDISARAFARDVDGLGIAVRVGVPVETGPLAGLDPSEIADPQPLAERIRSAIAAAGLAGRLGPKVSVVVDGGGAVSMDSVAADARLTAERHGKAVLWRLLIAGDAQTATPVALFEEDAAVGAVLSILTRIAECGRDARARDVSASLPTKPLSFSAYLAVLPDDSLLGGPKGSSLERELLDMGFPSLVPLRAARATLAVALPFGHTDAARLADFTRRAESLGIIEIRPAPQRILLPICPSAEPAEAIRQAAAELGFITEASDPRRTIIACPGAPACASGKIAAREISAEVAEILEDHIASACSDLSIHISGCAKGCARQAAADITIVGGENGAGLVVGGTTKAMPVAYRSDIGLSRAIAAVARAMMVSRSARAKAEPSRGGAGGLAEQDKARLAAAFGQGRP